MAYINQPGGVILHLTDGTTEHFQYGQEVDQERLADYQRENLSQFADDQERTAYAPQSQTERAHAQAALVDQTQPNSTSDPVPGNYNELSEEDATALMMVSRDNPEIQARLVLHEKVFGGSRQKVVDAASSFAKSRADQLQQALEGGVTTFDQTPTVRDTEHEQERTERRSASERQAKSSSQSSGKTPAPNDG